MNEPLFLRAAAAAKLCCRSEGSWWRLNREKKNPASFKMGGTTFWHRAEILQWIEASCPSRDAWEARKAGA
jgi:predicted DNA-binding transcriptional regulator AlpA